MDARQHDIAQLDMFRDNAELLPRESSPIQDCVAQSPSSDRPPEVKVRGRHVTALVSRFERLAGVLNIPNVVTPLLTTRMEEAVEQKPSASKKCLSSK